MVAVAAAVFLELPLAAGCLYIALRVKRVLAPRREGEPEGNALGPREG